MTTTRPTSHVTEALCAQTPWFLDAELQPRDGGWAAEVRINPLLAEARAEQQGLADWSLSAAAASPEVRKLWEHYVELANQTLPVGDQIVEFVPLIEDRAGALQVA